MVAQLRQFNVCTSCRRLQANFAEKYASLVCWRPRQRISECNKVKAKKKLRSSCMSELHMGDVRAVKSPLWIDRQFVCRRKAHIYRSMYRSMKLTRENGMLPKRRRRLAGSCWPREEMKGHECNFYMHAVALTWERAIEEHKILDSNGETIEILRTSHSRTEWMAKVVVKIVVKLRIAILPNPLRSWSANIGIRK